MALPSLYLKTTPNVDRQLLCLTGNSLNMYIAKHIDNSVTINYICWLFSSFRRFSTTWILLFRFCMISCIGSSATWRFVYQISNLKKNSQHGVKHPTCKDLHKIDNYTYLLFSCSNSSRRMGSCLDAFMRSSVDHSLLFALADEPVEETFL